MNNATTAETGTFVSVLLIAVIGFQGYEQRHEIGGTVTHKYHTIMSSTLTKHNYTQTSIHPT